MPSGLIETTELVEALRQCDGEQVQCVVMVRDDFWIALSRFVDDVECSTAGSPELEGLVDLFTLRSMPARSWRPLGEPWWTARKPA